MLTVEIGGNIQEHKTPENSPDYSAAYPYILEMFNVASVVRHASSLSVETHLGVSR